MSATDSVPNPKLLWQRVVKPSLPPNLGRLGGVGLGIGLLLLLPLFVWFYCRIEPGPGEIAVLIHKTGDDLPSGAMVLVQSDYSTTY